MADAPEVPSKKASGDKGRTLRPERLRVVNPAVQEVLRSPRRSRGPKEQQPPTPQPPPPPQKEEEEEEEVERPRYDCAFQDEGVRDSAPPDLVWGKVRSHPWWPGQVFDPADASEVALQHQRSGALLVAYFWDRTFSWSDASAVLPFRSNFARLSTQSTMSGFSSAVDAALQEVERRVEAGLSCGCFGSGVATKQEVKNSGIRQGAYGAATDGVYMRDALSCEAFLDYILALGRKPLAGADLLDLATAKAQLRAFNRSRSPRDLPEFVIFEGIEGVVEVTPHTKMKRAHKSSERYVPSKEKKARRAGTSSHKNEALPEAANEEGVKEDEGVPSRETAHDLMSEGKRSKKTPRTEMKKVHKSSEHDVPSKEKKAKRAGTSSHKNEALPEAANEEGVKEDGGLRSRDAAHGLMSERKRSKNPKSLVNKKTVTSNKAVDDHLNESKSGRMLRSMRKTEDALEGSERLRKDDSSQILSRENEDSLQKENKRRRASSAHKKGKITEDGDGAKGVVAKDSSYHGKRRPGSSGNSLSKRVLISQHGRKKKKLSELMGETSRSNPAPNGRSKTQGKRAKHESTEEAEDAARDSKDTARNRKRKKLNTLGDLASPSQVLSRKKSTKVGELSSKTAGHVSQTPPVAKAKGSASQTKSNRAKKQRVAANKSPRTVEDAFSEESPSCGEMLSQLSLAACALRQREKMSPSSVNFLTDFRKNSYACSPGVGEEVPEIAANSESSPLEQPVADHMQDEYWADILINVDKPLSSLGNKKDENKKRTSKKVHHVRKSLTLGSADEPQRETNQDTEVGERLRAESKQFVANGSNVGSKSAEETENSLLAGLVLHFSRPNAVPSCNDLIKIFSQYGPVSEAKTEIASSTNSAQVIFKRRMDAEAAFGGAGKISALGPALVSFRLTDFPATASGNESSHGASKSG